MYESERFNLGIITLPSVVRPSPEDVRNAIGEDPDEATDVSSNETAIHRHSVDAVVLHSDHSQPYCHFQYRAAFSADGTACPPETASARAQPWHVRSRAFYFENGQFAVQPTRGLSETWLPSFIARITETDVGDEFKFYDSKSGNSGSHRSHDGSASNGTISRVPTSDGSDPCVSPPTPDDQPADPLAGDPADLLEKATRTGAVSPQRTPRGTSSDPAFAPGTVVATWDVTDWPNDAGAAKRATEIHRQIEPYLQSHVN